MSKSKCSCIDELSCCPVCFKKRKQELQDQLWDANAVLRKLQKQVEELEERCEAFPDTSKIRLVKFEDEQGRPTCWPDFEKVMKARGLTPPKEGVKSDLLHHQELIPEEWRGVAAILFFNDRDRKEGGCSFGIWTETQIFVEGIRWDEAKQEWVHCQVSEDSKFQNAMVAVWV
jgi:hypothetical protein